MSLEVIKTNRGLQFIVDSETILESHGLLKATYTTLYARRINNNSSSTTGQAPTYEYPSILFQNLNLCLVADISNRRPATNFETNLYEYIRQGKKLDGDIRKKLRSDYSWEN